MNWVIGAIVALIVLIGTIFWGGYNTFQKRDEAVLGKEREMFSCYQKRLDLVTNLANTVQQYAGHEKGIFEEVTKARATASQTTVNINSEEAAKQFMSAQQAISGSLSRLIATAENYPNLKAAGNFLLLQRQLSNIETQCSLVRNQYIREVQAYNVNVKSFPTNLIAQWAGYSTKPQLQFDDEKGLKSSPRVFAPK